MRLEARKRKRERASSVFYTSASPTLHLKSLLALQIGRQARHEVVEATAVASLEHVHSFQNDIAKETELLTELTAA